MIVGIDVSNIRGGGGVTHLKMILEQTEPDECHIKKIVLWGGRTTLENFPHKPWLELREIHDLNQYVVKRLLWQQTELTKLVHNCCDILFVPGGLYLGGFNPFVTMFQNMQIFETKERNRESGKEWLRLRFLQWAQSRTFRKASGLICLSEYAKNYLTQFHSHVIAKTPIQLIAHGTEGNNKDSSLSVSNSPNKNNVIRILYVSTVKKYKHHWNLIDALGVLRKEGASIELHLVGGGDSQALNIMQDAINRNKSDNNFIFYHGNLSYKETLDWYNKVDIFVFPSTCETFGISLLEAMSAGLPIASSDRGPMPEVLKDAGLYFNPESVTSIKNCLRYMIENHELRNSFGSKAENYSQTYSWKKCSEETFAFIRSVYEKK